MTKIIATIETSENVVSLLKRTKTFETIDGEQTTYLYCWTLSLLNKDEVPDEWFGNFWEALGAIDMEEAEVLRQLKTLNDEWFGMKDGGLITDALFYCQEKKGDDEAMKKVISLSEKVHVFELLKTELHRDYERMELRK